MNDIVDRLRGWKHAAFRRDGSTLGTMQEAADAIERLRAEVAALRQRLRGVVEVYAGMEGVPEPQTACEGYLLHVLKQMVDAVREGK